MSYTNDDQNGDRARDQQRDGSGTTAAQTWIDANPTIWQPWVDAGLAAQG